MDNKTVSQTKQVLHSFDVTHGKGLFNTTSIIVFIVLALLGIATGYFLARNSLIPSVSELTEESGVSGGNGKKGSIYGSSDEKTFKDSAEGILKEGGIEGEGAYHLERPGGPSQYVYLTSAVIDLSEFEGKKVKVWGETNAAKKAGWLMDVGRLQVLK